MRARAFGAVASTLALVGCAASTTAPEESASPEEPASPTPTETTPEVTVGPDDGQVVEATVAAPSLEGNLLGDPAEREVIIYLPPSYEVTDDRYPVVYYLAGHTQRVGAFTQHREELWEQMLSEDAREFIIVELDGVNSLSGNFYANSPVGGNAEDFLTQDLVGYLDATYRTVSEAGARGLTGFSMGGSGTINVGLANPDVFGALFPLSPGLFVEDGGLEGFLRDNGNWRAYGATVAPDVDAEYPYFHSIEPDVPLAEQDPDLVAAWRSGFGDLRRKIEDYLARPERLAEIRLVYGTTDSYWWIPEGSAYFLELLEEYGIPHSSRTFEGGHSVDYLYFAEDCVDFFSRTLTD